jgi:hypothetical protein
MTGRPFSPSSGRRPAGIVLDQCRFLVYTEVGTVLGLIRHGFWRRLRRFHSKCRTSEALASDNLFSQTFGRATQFMDPRRVMLGVRLNLGR